MQEPKQAARLNEEDVQRGRKPLSKDTVGQQRGGLKLDAGMPILGVSHLRMKRRNGTPGAPQVGAPQRDRSKGNTNYDCFIVSRAVSAVAKL